MPSDPTGWPSVCKCGATAVSPCNRSPCFRGERDPGRIYNEAEVAAALAQARREGMEEAAQIARRVVIPDECCATEAHGRLVQALACAEAIRAKAQEPTP